VVAAARSRAVAVLAITDHNSAKNAREAVSHSSNDLFIIPGVEITTTDGHLVALFDPERLEDLEEFARPASLALLDLDDGSQRSKRSMVDLIDDIEQRGGLAILAHVDAAGAAYRPNPAALNDILVRPGLCAIEYVDEANAAWFTDTDPDPVRKQAWARRTKAIGPRMARVMSSDAHDPALVGLDQPRRLITRLRLDELNFVAVRNALVHHPDARCRVEASLPPAYPRILSAQFTGGFLDGLQLEFSPNLTAVIGGRGSGKSTALRAIRYCLGAPVDAEIDGKNNMPDVTEIRFVDGLGSERVAARARGGEPYDLENPASAIGLSFQEIEQNAGAEFQTEDPDNPTETAAFLDRFVDFSDIETRLAADLTAINDNGARIVRTSAASDQLKKIRKEKAELERSLEVATRNNLPKVAGYAQVLSREEPLRLSLERQLKDLPMVGFPKVPDVDAEARAFKVDLAGRPAQDHVEGANGLRDQLDRLRSQLAAAERELRLDATKAIGPALKVLDAWKKSHDSWNERIEERRQELRKAGLDLQVKHLDAIRVRLAAIEVDERKWADTVSDYRRARETRKTLLQNLSTTRTRRVVLRKVEAARMEAALNRTGGARVSITWRPRGMRGEWSNWLGPIFNLRSPRKERLAATIEPDELAEVVWKGKPELLLEIGGPSETFLDSTAEARRIHAELFTWERLFELETWDLPDRPEVFVHWPGEPPGRGKPLGELSLGQARSVLVGFLLASANDAPLILDQPEDHLDGPFIAETVVGYLHGAKEKRQLIIATHNGNLTVLGDAEYVLPFFAKENVAKIQDAGAVDSSKTREQVLRLLEGGREAYRKRGLRYGYKL